MQHRLHRAKSAIVLLSIGIGGLLVSIFVGIPGWICYMLAGAALCVEGMDLLENA